MIQILVAEDDPGISEMLKISLNDEGYQCTCALDGETAAELLERRTFDLVLLDISLSFVNGYELMELIHPQHTPVMILSANAEVIDKVRGLRLGAEDYITKPFDMLELLARVDTVLRRCGKNEPLLRILDVTIDTDSRIVRKNGQPVKLTNKEYELLLLFAHNPNIALFRDRIYERVWGDYYSDDSRTVDLHVQRMRKKLGWEDKLVAVYKIGYRLIC